MALELWSEGSRIWAATPVRRVAAGEVTIAYRHFFATEPVTQRLILLHGGRAHAGWWQWVVHCLPPHYEVIVPDLSGHGLSGHRGVYSPESWADDVEAVAADAGWSQYAMAGHSMGGKVAVAVARRAPPTLLAFVDTPFAVPGQVDPFAAPPVRIKRVYPTFDEALARFHPTPDQPFPHPEALRQVAAEGLCPEGDGWTWRFDPQAYRIFVDTEVLAWLSQLNCPIGYIRAADSAITSPATIEQLAQRVGDLRVRVLPGAFHHAPMDSPAQTAAALVALIEGL
jgi:pimeloyl-ACP methyl ester carboxylesterase